MRRRAYGGTRVNHVDVAKLLDGKESVGVSGASLWDKHKLLAVRWATRQCAPLSHQYRRSIMDPCGAETSGACPVSRDVRVEQSLAVRCQVWHGSTVSSCGQRMRLHNQARQHEILAVRGSKGHHAEK